MLCSEFCWYPGLNFTCLIITGPPKALDEDETEFLDNYEAVSSGSLFAAFCFMNLSYHGS